MRISGRPMLEVRDLQVSYGAAPAINGIHLKVEAGALVVVVGPNGAGKTTLINAIAGVHRMQSGRLDMDGQSLADVAPHRYCDYGIALVPEGRRLFTGLTVRENLELGSYRAAARERRQEALRPVCALFPVLNERLNAPAGALSGGQQQMLAIGRALMALPKLLLLDEPSLGLAPLMVERIFETIAGLKADGRTILLVEQNVHHALDVGDRAYVLETGRIVLEGPTDVLRRDPAVERSYLGAGGVST